MYFNSIDFKQNEFKFDCTISFYKIIRVSIFTARVLIEHAVIYVLLLVEENWRKEQ